MAEEFDPYYIWLGIPPHEQPPNHYRILGIPVFTSNTDVIENAADRQMAHLKTFQIGEQSDLSQKLLNEVSAAWMCLQNPQQKAAYDQKLRQKMMPAAATKTPVPKTAVETSRPKTSSADEPAATETPKPPRQPQTPSTAPSGKRSLPKFGLFIGAATMLAVLACGVYLIGRPKPVVKTESEVINPESPDEKDENSRAEGFNDDKQASKPERKHSATEKNTPSPDPAKSFETELPKLAVPSNQERLRIGTRLRLAHNLNFKRTPQDKMKLAGELFDKANSSDDPVEKYVLMEKAAELAAEGDNVEWSLSFVDAMAATYEMDPINKKIQILTKYAITVKTTAGIENLVRISDRVISSATAEKRYEQAFKLARVVQLATMKKPGLKFRKHTRERLKETKDALERWKDSEQGRNKGKP